MPKSTPEERRHQRRRTEDDQDARQGEPDSRPGRNEGLAQQSGVSYQSRYGDWRELFRQVDRIDKVTKADIRRVANQTFVPTNRTVGIIETKPRRARPAVQTEVQQ